MLNDEQTHEDRRKCSAQIPRRHIVISLAHSNYKTVSLAGRMLTARATFPSSFAAPRHQLYLAEGRRVWTMRRTFVGTFLGLGLLLGYTPQAQAGALLTITTGGFTAACNTT